MAEQLEQLSLGYQQTLQLLRDLKSGDVSLDSVEVTEQGWSLVPATAPKGKH